MKLRYYLLVLILSASSATKAQDADSLLLGDELDFLIAGDSLSVLSLLDSLLSADNELSSQLIFKAGYNSNVLSAGRTLGIENFGLSPGLSYYHRTGIYADVTGYWSQDFSPKYYLTIASVGYSHIFNRYFSALTAYDRYIYHFDDASFIPYSNSLSITPILDVKKASLSVNYSFYFGDKNVHRIAPVISGRIEFKNVLGFKRIAFLPMITMLLGDETFYKTETWIPRTRLEALRYYRDYGTIYPTFTTEIKEFGIMNYAFSLPVSVSYKKINLLFTYCYNIPKALPSETLTFSESSYLMASISYAISLRK